MTYLTVTPDSGTNLTITNVFDSYVCMIRIFNENPNAKLWASSWVPHINAVLNEMHGEQHLILNSINNAIERVGENLFIVSGKRFHKKVTGSRLGDESWLKTMMKRKGDFYEMPEGYYPLVQDEDWCEPSHPYNWNICLGLGYQDVAHIAFAQNLATGRWHTVINDMALMAAQTLQRDAKKCGTKVMRASLIEPLLAG